MNKKQKVEQSMYNSVAEVSDQPAYPLTLLQAAVLQRCHIIVDRLIKSQVDINARSSLNRTALHFAFSNFQPKQSKRSWPLQDGHPDVCMVRKLLTINFIRINVRDVRGDTPLMWAVMDKQADIVSALLSNGADSSIPNEDSSTPLHIALSADAPCLDVVFFLLFHGAELDCADKEGKTPIDILIQNAINTQSYEFAYRVLCVIKIRYKIVKPIGLKLKASERLHQCWKTPVSNLPISFINIIKHDEWGPVPKFLLFGLDGLDAKNSFEMVYRPVIEDLLVGNSLKHLHYVLEIIPKPSLCRILENNIIAMHCDELDAPKHKKISITNNCNDQGCMKRSATDFFSKINVYLLAKYLSNEDIFCLSAAFLKGDIHKSLQSYLNEEFTLLRSPF